jgi:hypothetical protein
VLVRGHHCHLIGTEGSSPPLPHIEVSNEEGAALVALGLAKEVDGQKVKAKGKPAPEKTPEKTPEPEKKPEGEGEPQHDRADTIAEALDLVEGEPTVEAVADITGLADVTAEEIAAAVAAKDSAD